MLNPFDLKRKLLNHDVFNIIVMNLTIFSAVYMSQTIVFILFICIYKFHDIHWEILTYILYIYLLEFHVDI